MNGWLVAVLLLGAFGCESGDSVGSAAQDAQALSDMALTADSQVMDSGLTMDSTAGGPAVDARPDDTTADAGVPRRPTSTRRMSSRLSRLHPSRSKRNSLMAKTVPLVWLGAVWVRRTYLFGLVLWMCRVSG